MTCNAEKWKEPSFFITNLDTVINDFMCDCKFEINVQVILNKNEYKIL